MVDLRKAWMEQEFSENSGRQPVADRSVGKETGQFGPRDPETDELCRNCFKHFA